MARYVVIVVSGEAEARLTVEAADLDAARALAFDLVLEHDAPWVGAPGEVFEIVQVNLIEGG